MGLIKRLLLSNAAAESYANALRSNTSLTSLDLSYCEISNVGIKHIADAMKYNTTLTALKLGDYYMEFFDEDPSDDLLKKINSFLEGNRKLNKVSF